jgi:hypothetical protein
VQPTTHVVRQRPPIRALALAASGMIAGAALLLLADLLRWPLAVTVAGAVVLLAGAALFVAAWWVARSRRVEVLLDEHGYRISGPGVLQSGAWADIERVTSAADRLTLHRKDGVAARLVVPTGAAADLVALGQDIASRLDEDRGYGR